MEKNTIPGAEKPHYAQPQQPRQGAPQPKPNPRPNQDEEHSLPFLPIG